MPRCKYSQYGLDFLQIKQQREGEFLGPIKGREISVKVLWDGAKTIKPIHSSFIEIIPGEKDKVETAQ